MPPRLFLKIPSSGLAERVREQVRQRVQPLLADARRAGAEAALTELKQAAAQELHTTAEAYQQALAVQERADGQIVLALQGEQAAAIENGYGPFDMKPGLLAHAKQSKTGVAYVNVSLGKTGMFRRVSANSAPSSWQHPGYAGAHLFEKLKERLRVVAMKAIAVALRAQGLDVEIR